MMKVFYYYWYLFYKKFWDPDPQLGATLAFTFLESLLINVILEIILANVFCFRLSKYYMIGILGICLLTNTFYFFTSKKIKQIVNREPKYFNNHRLTIFLVFSISLALISTLFWTGDYVNRILVSCH